jgi:hypothetical protein
MVSAQSLLNTPFKPSLDAPQTTVIRKQDSRTNIVQERNQSGIASCALGERRLATSTHD